MSLKIFKGFNATICLSFSSDGPMVGNYKHSEIKLEQDLCQAARYIERHVGISIFVFFTSNRQVFEEYLRNTSQKNEAVR